MIFQAADVVKIASTELQQIISHIKKTQVISVYPCFRYYDVPSIILPVNLISIYCRCEYIHDALDLPFESSCNGKCLNINNDNDSTGVRK